MDRGPPVDTSRERAGQSLGQGLGTSAGARQRHSNVDRRVVPSTYVEPTRNWYSAGGMGSQMPFTPPPGVHLGASSSQPWSADPWACWYEMERRRHAYDLEMQRRFMTTLQPYQYSPCQQRDQRPSGTLRISEQDPATPRTELDQDLERYMSRSRNKEHVIDIVADDDSD